MRFGRNKCVALALLCGCDYCDGVRGIGKDSVVKWFERFDDAEILNRLRAWNENENLFAELEREISNKNVCTSCGHAGKLQMHTRNGCVECGTRKSCDFTKYRDRRLAIKNELSMRSKATLLPDFPNQQLIDEFLIRKDNVCDLDLKWKRPDIVQFLVIKTNKSITPKLIINFFFLKKFADKYLTWEEDYAFEKFLPILCRWQVLNFKQKSLLKPQCIKKIRNPKGVASYEIIWTDVTNAFFKQEQLSTNEPQKLVETAYPDLVESFKQSKIKPKKQPRKRKNAVDVIEKMMENTSISEPKPKKTLDSYFKRAVVNNFEKNTISSTPVKLTNTMDLSLFDDTKDDADLSDIVGEIVATKPKFILERLLECGYEIQQENNCSFFISEPTENDVFEETFNELCSKNVESSEDDEENEDSFAISEVPLMERLKIKNK